jgi:nicotinamidase-related amidase
MRIHREDAVAVVIDMQERLFPHVEGREELARNVVLLIRGLKALGVPIHATQQYTRGLGPTIPAVHEVLSPFYPIDKNAFSCWDEPAFRAALESSGKGTVLLCGIEAHVCVLQTALDLKAAGFRPVVVEDCTASRSGNDQRVAAARMAGAGVTVTTCESILFELLRRAGTPEFKEVSNLIKAAAILAPAPGRATERIPSPRAAADRAGIVLDFDVPRPEKKASGDQATGGLGDTATSGPGERSAGERPGVRLSFDVPVPDKRPAEDKGAQRAAERKTEEMPRGPLRKP